MSNSTFQDRRHVRTYLDIFQSSTFSLRIRFPSTRTCAVYWSGIRIHDFLNPLSTEWKVLNTLRSGIAWTLNPFFFLSSVDVTRYDDPVLSLNFSRRRRAQCYRFFSSWTFSFKYYNVCAVKPSYDHCTLLIMPNGGSTFWRFFTCRTDELDAVNWLNERNYACWGSFVTESEIVIEDDWQ